MNDMVHIISLLSVLYLLNEHTSFNCSNESGLQFSWHQGSVCPEKWNLSTTKFRHANRFAMGVSLFRLALVANLFKWHPSSYITNSTWITIIRCNYIIIMHTQDFTTAGTTRCKWAPDSTTACICACKLVHSKNTVCALLIYVQ